MTHSLSPLLRALRRRDLAGARAALDQDLAFRDDVTWWSMVTAPQWKGHDEDLAKFLPELLNRCPKSLSHSAIPLNTFAKLAKHGNDQSAQMILNWVAKYAGGTQEAWNDALMALVHRGRPRLIPALLNACPPGQAPHLPQALATAAARTSDEVWHVLEPHAPADAFQLALTRIMTASFSAREKRRGIQHLLTHVTPTLSDLLQATVRDDVATLRQLAQDHGDPSRLTSWLTQVNRACAREGNLACLKWGVRTLARNPDFKLQNHLDQCLFTATSAKQLQVVNWLLEKPVSEDARALCISRTVAALANTLTDEEVKSTVKAIQNALLAHTPWDDVLLRLPPTDFDALHARWSPAQMAQILARYPAGETPQILQICRTRALTDVVATSTPSTSHRLRC